jgi:hypothetical protein
MKLRHTLILTALTIALNGTFVANAADVTPAKDAKAEKASPATKDKRPVSAERDKQETKGKAEDNCCRNPSSAGKKASHDHH